MNIVLVVGLIQKWVRHQVFSHLPVWSYLRRILTRDVLDTPPATLLLMLHGFFECIDLLDYSIPSNSFVVSQFRYPFSPAVIQQYLCWVRRWDSNSRAIQPRFKLHGIKGQDLNLPFYYYSMPDIVDDWPSLSPLEKAIKLICFQCELQISSAIKSNELNNSALIPIFFEDICFFPTQSLEYLMTSFSSLSSPASSSIKPRNLTRFFRSSNLPRKNPDMAIYDHSLIKTNLASFADCYFSNTLESFHPLYGSDLNAKVLEQCYSVSDLYISLHSDLSFCN